MKNPKGHKSKKLKIPNRKWSGCRKPQGLVTAPSQKQMYGTQASPYKQNLVFQEFVCRFYVCYWDLRVPLLDLLWLREVLIWH